MEWLVSVHFYATTFTRQQRQSELTPDLSCFKDISAGRSADMFYLNKDMQPLKIFRKRT